MKYADARSNISSGDVLAWSHRAGWFASWYDFKINLVRLFTRSEYSHVAIAIRLAGRVFALEAVTGGIRLIPLSKALPCYHLAYQSIDIDRAMSVCGEPYSQFEAIRGWFGATDNTNGQWECAEYVQWVHTLPCIATPSAVVDYVLANGGRMTYCD